MELHLELPGIAESDLVVRFWQLFEGYSADMTIQGRERRLKVERVIHTDDLPTISLKVAVLDNEYNETGFTELIPIYAITLVSVP